MQEKKSDLFYFINITAKFDFVKQVCFINELKNFNESIYNECIYLLYLLLC